MFSDKERSNLWIASIIWKCEFAFNNDSVTLLRDAEKYNPTNVIVVTSNGRLP